MTNENTLPENSIPTLNQLAGALQDMWHYGALIKPSPTRGCSTFDGDRHYAGLIGKLKAYERLREKIVAFQIPELPAFVECNLPRVEHIETMEQLVEQTGYAAHAINTVCKANNVDGYSGEIITGRF